jgi:hypothetical protein
MADRTPPAWHLEDVVNFVIVFAQVALSLPAVAVMVAAMRIELRRWL